MKKAIEKVNKNGWKSPFSLNYEFNLDEINANFNTAKFFQIYPILSMSIIFSKDFAKAFFGDRLHCNYKNSYDCQICDCGEYDTTEYCWQHHLQQMVLEDEPLKYLEKFLDKE